MCRQSTWLLMSIVVTLAGACWALEVIEENRGSVFVRVIPPQRGGETVDNLVDSVAGALRKNRFTVVVESQRTSTPREIFAQDPGIHHVVADFVLGDPNHLEANVYSQGADSPRTLKADSAESLRAQVVQYLHSEQMVRWRLDRTVIKNEYSAAMNSGLKHMLREDNLDQAIAAFSKAADLDKSNAVPYFNLSVCHYQRGDYAKCSESVDKGLELDPEHRGLKNQKAVLLMREGHFKEATQILEGIRGESAAIEWNLAYSYFELQEPQKAKQHLVKVLALDPDPSSTIRTVATSRLDELQKKENALRFVRRALWFALGGLLCVSISALIIILLRNADRQITATKLKSKDTLGLKIQVGIASVTMLFSILNLILGQLLGK